MKRSALLIVHNTGHFIELARVARLLASTDLYRVLIWFGNSYPGVERDLKFCSAEGWDVIAASGISPGTAKKQTSSGISSFLRRTKSMVWQAFAIRRKVSRFRAMLRESAVELLIACEDNVEYSSHILIRVADAQKIPTVIVPFTITNATEAAEFYFSRPENIVSSNFINRLIARVFPDWVYTHRGRKLLRLPVERILVLECSGLAPTQPWMLNNGRERLVAVESDRMLQHYLEEGLSPEQLIVTGALSDDVLFEAACAVNEKRKKLFDELDLPHGRPLLLCTLPPNQFPGDGEFASYEDLLSFWMESLSQIKEWNVVIRPHPRIREDDMNVIRSFDIPITVLDTASLVPLCNLYLASVSATIRWAIACGIPVINYDVYRMGYKDYADVEGVLTVENQQSFLQTLDRLTNDREYYKKIEAAQKKEMNNWGMLDGKSGERMLQLFEQVAVKNIRRI